MLWNAKEARPCGVRVSRPGCREPSWLLPTRRWSPKTGLTLWASQGPGKVAIRRHLSDDPTSSPKPTSDGSLHRAFPAGRYPKMAAGRERPRVLAVTTPGRSSATLDSKERHSPNHRTCQMPQVRITKQRRTADTRWRRQRDLLLPLDPRDPDVTRAKQRQRKRGYP
jgi:hypothetical protein